VSAMARDARVGEGVDREGAVRPACREAEVARAVERRPTTAQAPPEPVPRRRGRGLGKASAIQCRRSFAAARIASSTR
jgi:hypothetical protein